jgi:tripartite-type tricarboxylate transporter receptor subunit TctC
LALHGSVAHPMLAGGRIAWDRRAAQDWRRLCGSTHDGPSPREEVPVKCSIARGCALALSLFVVFPAAAQTFPDHPVKVVVPYTPGGGTDSVARAVSQGLQELWGQPVVVENKPGAGTALGSEFVAKSPADGYTLLFSDSSALVINPHVYPKLRYDPIKDFEPVALTVRLAPVLAISNDVKAKSVAEFIALAKAHPGEVSYASPGTGTYTHIAMEYFKHMAGIDMLHVPYKGSSPAMTDLMTGRVSSYMVTYSVFDAYEKEGKLKILAAATEARLPNRPDLPTIGETVKGYSIDVWFGFAAPAGTPTAVLDKIHDDVNKIVNDPAFVEKFIKPQAFIAGNLSRADFAARVKSDFAKWGDLVKTTGVKVE